MHAHIFFEISLPNNYVAVACVWFMDNSLYTGCKTSTTSIHLLLKLVCWGPCSDVGA